MKSLTKMITVVILAAASLNFYSCSKTNAAANAGTTAATDSVTTLLTTGSWAVSSLTEPKEDNTSKFKDYVLTFSSNGKLVAVKNGVEVQGTWTYSPAVTYYGSSSKEAIKINMGTGDPFRRLTGTWNIASRTASTIKMDNPEILEDEHLQLQKQ